MSAFAFPRLTPWVGRLLVANAVVLLVLETVAPALIGWLTFDPSLALERPWTFVTYMFVHGGLLHLAFNSLLLFFLGTAVEQRMGERAFPLFYLLCGLGGAVFSLLLASVLHVSPFVGASGAVLGVAVAFAMYWPDAELMVFPLPFPVRARILVLALLAFDVVGALLPGDGVAHLAHLGGALVGYLYFRFQGMPAAPVPTGSPRPIEPARARRAARAVEPPPRPRQPLRAAGTDREATQHDEINRVLDKISANGIESLTPAERRFLSDASARKRRDQTH